MAGRPLRRARRARNNAGLSLLEQYRAYDKQWFKRQDLVDRFNAGEPPPGGSGAAVTQKQAPSAQTKITPAVLKAGPVAESLWAVVHEEEGLASDSMSKEDAEKLRKLYVDRKIEEIVKEAWDNAAFPEDDENENDDDLDDRYERETERGDAKIRILEKQVKVLPADAAEPFQIRYRERTKRRGFRLPRE